MRKLIYLLSSLAVFATACGGDGGGIADTDGADGTEAPATRISGPRGEYIRVGEPGTRTAEDFAQFAGDDGDDRDEYYDGPSTDERSQPTGGDLEECVMNASSCEEACVCAGESVAFCEDACQGYEY